MNDAGQEYNKCELTFNYAFGDGDTQNGVTLTHALHPRVGITNSYANLLPNTNLSPPLIGPDTDGVWTGKGFIFMDDSAIEILDFSLTVDFANKRIEGYPMFKAGYKYGGFYLQGKMEEKFDDNLNQIINGVTCFGNWDGDTLKHVDKTRARLTCAIGEKGAVGYFLSAEDNLPYTGGFVVRPPQ